MVDSAAKLKTSPAWKALGTRPLISADAGRRRARLPVSDHELPGLTVPSGTQRARRWPRSLPWLLQPADLGLTRRRRGPGVQPGVKIIEAPGQLAPVEPQHFPVRSNGPLKVPPAHQLTVGHDVVGGNDPQSVAVRLVHCRLELLFAFDEPL